MTVLIAELYDEYQDRLYGYAMTLCRDSDFAGDLVQETFTRALANIELLARLPSYKRQSWLFSVMKNRFIDVKRKQKWEIRLADGFESELEEKEKPDIETRGLLSNLPVPMRDVVFRKFWMGMNSREIAEELSIPDGTVRYRLHGALKKIREDME